MAKARILSKGNGIEAYKSIRYSSSSEATWSISASSCHIAHVTLLFVHLEGEHVVVHDEADDVDQRRAKANRSDSDLMRYFRRPSGPDCDDLTFPITSKTTQRNPKRTPKRVHYCTDGSKDNEFDSFSNNDGPSGNNAIPTDLYNSDVYRKYISCVCRMNFKPDAGYVWYLRLRLHHIQYSGLKDIRIVNSYLRYSTTKQLVIEV